MKGLVVFLFFFLALASATLVQRPNVRRVADEKFLKRHQDLYRLLYHVHQPNPHTYQVDVARAFNIQNNVDKYSDPKVVERFLNLYNNGMLPKGRPFSVMYEVVLHEAHALFDLFYFAKDYDTFYQTACWAREFINEEMFVYALTTAVVHRDDCEGFVWPALYEILPYYFFPIEVVDLAYKVKMQGHGRDIPDVTQNKDNTVVINTNYSNWYMNTNQEQRLSYFTEDIGMNAFYYRAHLELPFWMDGAKYDVNGKVRGDFFFVMWHHLLARYYFERLSNGLGEIPEFSWEAPIEEGYNPQLKFINGLTFPERPNNYVMNRYGEIEKVRDYERRIRDAIDRGYVVHTNGTHIDLRNPENVHVVSSLVESNYDSPDLVYYGYPQFIARSLIGNSPRPMDDGHAVFPSALKFYQTSLRDPAYYQFGKYYYTMFFKKFKSFLKPYTQEELSCPGVKVQNVEVGKIVTYLEDFYADITNVVQYTPEDVEKGHDSLVILAKQSRLNHKPFTVTVNLSSERATKVVFRFFLGPKYNSRGEVLTLKENRENFVTYDQFTYELKAGKNTVERSSEDFWFTDKDFVSYRKIWSEMQSALDKKTEFVLSDLPEFESFPARLLMPKGRRGGMPFVLFVVVTPYTEPTVVYEQHPMIDSHVYGYPFDRPIVESHFQLSNMHFEDIIIFHKKESEINQSH